MRRFSAAAVCGAAWLVGAQAAAADAVTTHTFLAGLNETGALTNMHGTVERFDCGESAKDAARTACVGNVKFGSFGISVIVKTGRQSDDVTYAGAMMASPAMAPDDMKPSMAGTFLVMAARLMATFSSEVPQAKRAAALEKLMKGLNNDTNEIRLGKWVYGAGNGIALAFSVERADDRQLW